MNPAGLEAGKVNSFQAGLPYTLDGVVLYRNRNLIPNPSDTWEDLVEQAQLATQEDRVGAFLDRGFYFSGAHLLGLGGEIMNPDGTPAFNTEKGDEWLNLLISFDEAGPTDFLTTQDSERFGQGLVGTIFDTAANREKLADLIGSQNLAIDSWPFYGEGRLSGFLIPQLFFINNHAHQDSTRLASLFGTYLLSPEAQSTLAANGLIPAVIDAPVEDPLIIQAIQALRGNSPYPTISSIDLYRNALDTAIIAVTSGSATPAEALQAAEAVILAGLANSQITPTP